MRFQPLQWPHQVTEMTPAERRISATFGKKGRAGYKRSLTIHEAIARLERELRLWANIHADWRSLEQNIIVSAGYKNLRNDGLPSSGQTPSTPAVCAHAAYLDLAKKYHPNSQKIGDRDKFETAANAYAQAKQYFGI